MSFRSLAGIAALAGALFSAPAAAQGVRTVADALRAIEAAEPASERGAAPPMPVSNPGTWVISDDYPAWAAANGVTGTVGFVVDVDAEGRATGCTIRESSGVSELDEIACAKVVERGRFLPAHDASGRPVAGRWSSKVRWDLPQTGAKEAPKPGQLVLSMIVEADGSVSNCTVERAEGAAAQAREDVLCRNPGPFEPLLDSDGHPQRWRFRLVTSVEREALP